MEMTKEQYAEAINNQSDEGLGLATVCHQCKRHAYNDCFMGELHEKGYLCSSCVKALNEEAWAEHRRLTGVR